MRPLPPQRIAVLIPALNEALRIREVVQGALAHCPNVIVVDDGSSDDTVAQISDLPVQLIRHAERRGKGESLRDGFRLAVAAGYAGVLSMDGDGQHSPDLVEKLVGYWIDDGYDVIYTAKANRRNESALRRLAVHAFYGLVNWGARQKIPEDAGDFRLLSPRAAAALRSP